MVNRDVIHGQLSTERLSSLGNKLWPSISVRRPLYGGLGRRIGKSAGLVVWPGKHPSGQPIINNTYLPETVTTVIELKERAERYGCAAELNDGLGWLKKCLSVLHEGRTLQSGGDPAGSSSVQHHWNRQSHRTMPLLGGHLFPRRCFPMAMQQRFTPLPIATP